VQKFRDRFNEKLHATRSSIRSAKRAELRGGELVRGSETALREQQRDHPRAEQQYRRWFRGRNRGDRQSISPVAAHIILQRNISGNVNHGGRRFAPAGEQRDIRPVRVDEVEHVALVYRQSSALGDVVKHDVPAGISTSVNHQIDGRHLESETRINIFRGDDGIDGKVERSRRPARASEGLVQFRATVGFRHADGDKSKNGNHCGAS
jgi:hypothetical protein